jgi:ZIP family zinc transporter
VSFAQVVLLSAIAGGTIFLGLPVGRLRNLSQRTQVALTAAAGGIILFLVWDILSQAVEPIEGALDAAAAGTAAIGDFAELAIAGAGGIAVGLLSIAWLTRRLRPAVGETFEPSRLALGTAVGLGLHNLSEGLAIGSSAATGASTLALLLVIGFAMHNATEGFGIAAPLTRGERPSWGFLAGLGLIGGGPTFLGGILGYSFTSILVATAALGLAAGALIYVFNEMMSVSRRASSVMAANAALLGGLIAGFGTDFILRIAGA